MVIECYVGFNKCIGSGYNDLDFVWGLYDNREYCREVGFRVAEMW